MDRLVRDRTAPPHDSLAEAIMLNGVLWCPEVIGKYDLLPLLVFPEHRLLWQAMIGVHQRSPGLGCGAFYLAWQQELEAMRPGDGWALTDLLDGVYHDEARWRFREYQHDPATTEGMLEMSKHSHDFAWWLQRLKDCAEARQGIEKAQELAARYWRLDMDGARASARSAQSIGVQTIKVVV